MPLLVAIGRCVAAQRGYLLCWAPVFLALGIGAYFAFPKEPAPAHWAAIAGALALVLALTPRVHEDWRPIAGALALVLAGLLLAGARAHLVAEPVLGYRYYGPVAGRIVKIDRSASDAVRLTLDRVVLRDMAPERTPRRVRISLHGEQGYMTPVPGLRIALSAHLNPPAGPVEPGGFDFQRQAWFDGLGAIGYTRTPVLAAGPVDGGGVALRLYRARMAISAWVQRRMPGNAGAFAAAVMTGDRSAMDKAVIEDLRASNLSHLLAISGLHMGLVTGFIFALVRYGLVLVPRVGLSWPVKKIAAVVALISGGAYLALSGGNVATERAFVMVAVMFVAIIFEHRAVTLRAVAVAALIVLSLRPEVLTEPGFQMSFAATVALVAVFSALRGRRGPRLPAFMRGAAAVVISSAVAGAATAPVAAAHFNRIADFGLIANLASVPFMGLVVMPGAVLAAVLAPFGLGWIGLGVMRPAINWILGVAHWVAGIDGALTYVPAPPGTVLPLIALGALWAVLWRGPVVARMVGLAPILAGFVLWAGAQRPELLIADSGRLAGLMTDAGRALSKPRGDGFAARNWLENDGDGATQERAFARLPPGGDPGFQVFTLGVARVVLLGGRSARARLEAVCREAPALVVISVEARAPDGCQVYGPERLRVTGALALRRASSDVPGALEITSARGRAGRRIWNSGSR